MPPMTAVVMADSPNSGGKPPTTNSTPTRSVTKAMSRSIAALMTIPNSPKVIIVSGSEKALMMGLTKALRRPAMTATMISVVISLP